MKKMICLFVALAVCLSIAAPVFATETENEGFVPSITYKPSPEIIPIQDEEGNEVIGEIINEAGEVQDHVAHGCLDITPIAHVWDPEEEVPADVERLLTFVYEELKEDKMEIPYEKLENPEIKAENMVIRDLFDVRWACEDHRIMIEEQGILFKVTFKLGISADTEIYAMTYDEEADEWEPIVEVVNNGDGTVTCTFEHLCAVAFSMPMAAASVPAEPAASMPIWPWILILVLAVAAIIVIVIGKKNKKETAV